MTTCRDGVSRSEPAPVAAPRRLARTLLSPIPSRLAHQPLYEVIQITRHAWTRSLGLLLVTAEAAAQSAPRQAEPGATPEPVPATPRCAPPASCAEAAAQSDPSAAQGADAHATAASASPPSGELEREAAAAIAADLPSTAPSFDAPPPTPARTAMAGSGLMNPDLSVVLDVAVAYFGPRGQPIGTGAHDPSRNGFNFQQLEVAIGSSVDPYFRLDAFLVFSEHGVEVEEAFGTTLALPARLQLRAGRFLHRFGRVNATHPHGWSFVDQNLLVGRLFGPEGGGGLGVELSWLSPLPWWLELSATSMTASGAASARSFFGGRDLGVRDPRDLLHVVTVKQFFALDDDWSLLTGVSAALGPNATGRANRTDIVGLDGYLRYRPTRGAAQNAWTLQVEIAHRRRQIPRDVLADWNGYAQLVWQWGRPWAAAARWEYGSSVRGLDGQPVEDPLDPDWTADRHRGAVALTHWPTEFSRIRLQATSDFPAWLDAPRLALFCALELVTGAHGAHAF
ncbi:MAG: zinc-regulated TonB-dependent outer membrane receptor [Myxococcota bacterium]|nr:zinc-regulated TonB-dependent outer membrane receptor [Myxococcota bacterium]MDW8363540.1 zinc-regulated TonB-dependent outer membrane receptor [Myxococcales bacterium]